MTLRNLIIKIRESFPGADEKDICQSVNELESELKSEIFSPAGVECRNSALDVKKDIDCSLILSDEHSAIYTSYISHILALGETDYERANAFSDIFNQKFDELAAEFRRQNIPIKRTPIRGGMFL